MGNKKQKGNKLKKNYKNCITFPFTPSTSSAIFLKNSENISKPDIEEFIERLLSSDKFEVLANKIAERAADKIITLQQGTPQRYTPQHDKNTLNQLHNSTKLNHIEHTSNKFKNCSFRANEAEEINETEKPKLETVAIMEHLATVTAEELSLNFKHFTTKHVATDPTPKTTKTTDYHYPNSHKKRRYGSKILNEKARTADTTTTEEEEDINTDGKNHKDKSNMDDSDMSDDERKESSEKERQQKNDKVERHVKENQQKETSKSNLENFESSSSESENSSTSSENEFTTIATTNHKVIENKLTSAKDESSENSDSDTTDKIESTTKPKIYFLRSENFPSVESEMTSRGSDSNENKLTNIADSSNLHEKLTAKERVKIKKNLSNKVEQDPKIDFKNKIREQNGKLYKFDDSPDYAEYNEKVSSVLKSVKEKKVKEDTVNQDLLDLVR